MEDTSKDRPDRDKRLNVPMTEEEKQEARMEAARAGKSMAAWAREKMFGQKEAVPA